MDPAFYALSQLRRRRLDPCVDTATEMLERNPYDLQAWFVKTRALTLKSWYDDTEAEEDGVAELLLEDNAMSSAPRPGTSLNRPLSTAGGSRVGTSGGRPPTTGFARPGSMAGRTGSRAGGRVETAFQGARPGTTRPVTTSGRFVRLGTASMASQQGGPFIDLSRMDFRKYAERPALAKVLCDYILYVEHNPRKAMELCAECTKAAGFDDWWWKARLGKCYFQLGLMRDAERQFKSSIKQQENIATLLELGKVYLKLDQPLAALEMFQLGSERNPRDHHLVLGMARIYDLLSDSEHAIELYRKVLLLDSTSVEAIACIAANSFYADQPEVALRTYRRLLQMGITTTELWNNLGLTCFYASQYDMALSCLERAVGMADDASVGTVWFNIGLVAVGIGDVSLAHQAFKIASNVDPNLAEAFNNLAILELRKGNVELSRNLLHTASYLGNTLHEPSYNAALLNFKLGDFQQAFSLCQRALEAYPDHSETIELRKQLRSAFATL